MIKKFSINPTVITHFSKLLKMLFYFYKSPEERMLVLDSVEELILERFQLYSLPGAMQYDTEEFNYYDRISHLIMAVIAIHYPYFKDTFVKGEVKLFKEKLKVEKGAQTKKELLEASEYLITLSQCEEYRILQSELSKKYQLMQSIIKGILSKSSHSFKKSHSKMCRKYKLTLPFTSLLKLVSKREVAVKNGKVSLSCGRWHEILEVIFEFLLQIELQLLGNCDEMKKAIFESEDDRMRQIIKRFTNILTGSLNISERIVNAEKIDDISLYFPPCMANLHQILRRTHRLSYDSRYQYTLFLRDIGVSVEDNIAFWESEYQKPCKNSSCTHDWKDNQRRYKYQIEHVYGLIGSHDRKTSHSCDKFVNDLQSKMDGGCPFQHFTSEQLEKALPRNMAALPDVEDIFLNKNSAMPQRACAAYLNCLQRLSKQRMNPFNDYVNKWFYIVSPLQFYNIAKNF